MANKIGNIVIWVIVTLIVVGIGWFILQPVVKGYPRWELYSRLFIVLFSVSTFAQLRLYNAIVQNTRFSIKLRDALIKFMQTIPVLDRSLRNLNSTMGNVKSSADSVKKSIEKNADATDELTNKIQNIKNLKTN